jgi:RsiW-degrading membrane proteinase PrsW (M82 family)
LSFVVSLLAAVLPSGLLIWYFYALDFHRGAKRDVLVMFALGFVTVVPAVIVQIPLLDLCGLIPSPYGRGAARAFVAVAPTEEFFKFLLLVLFCARKRNFNGPRDGMVYGAVASLGFATIENIGYVYRFGWTSALARAFSAVPSHAFFGAIMGYFYGRAHLARRGRLLLLCKSIGIPILLHGLYDFPFLTVDAKYGIRLRELADADLPLVLSALLLMPGVLIFMWAWLLRIERRLQREADQAVFAAFATEPPRTPTSGPPQPVTPSSHV